MQQFRNMTEFAKVMEKQVLTSFLEQEAEKIKELIRTYIDDRFYKLFDPEQYIRTEQLLNSATCSKVEKTGQYKYQIVIYLNEDDVVYKDDDASYVWMLASVGYHGIPIEAFHTEGRFWDETLDDINSGKTVNIFQDFKSYAISKGFVVR